MHKTRHKRILVVVLGLAAGIQTPRAQVPSAVPLAEVQRLKCAFTLLATGTWDNTGPSAEVTKAGLSMQFEAIDTQEGTANVGDVSTLSAGAPRPALRAWAAATSACPCEAPPSRAGRRAEHRRVRRA